MQQTPTLQAVPTAPAATRASRLDEHVALFQSEHAKLMELDKEVLTLREQRKAMLAQIPAAKARREELRQGRINQLMGGVVSLEAAREYRELTELLDDANEAASLSESQEKRLALPLYQTQLAVNSAQSMVAGCYESYLDHKLAPAILPNLKQQLAELAALTLAKGCIIGMEGARRWALNELGSALKEAMNGEQVALEGDSPAARQALVTSTRPQCADLLALCDSPGKRQCLQRELEEKPPRKTKGSLPGLPICLPHPQIQRSKPMHHSKAPDPQQELHPWINSDSLPHVALSKRQGRRIKHPQAMTKPRTICTISPIFGLMPEIYSFLGAWVGSQRKRPHCAFLGLALLCGYPIRLGLPKPRIVIMIFTFLIATHGKVSDLHRIRTISAVADTEAQARANLPGLPLVFVARIPCAKRGQA